MNSTFLYALNISNFLEFTNIFNIQLTLTMDQNITKEKHKIRIKDKIKNNKTRYPVEIKYRNLSKK